MKASKIISKFFLQNGYLHSVTEGETYKIKPTPALVIAEIVPRNELTIRKTLIAPWKINPLYKENGVERVTSYLLRTIKLIIKKHQ